MSKKLPLCHSTFGQCVLSLIFLMTFFFSHNGYSQATLIKDINTLSNYWDEEYSNLVSTSDGTLYFVVSNNELWKANGMTVSVVKKLNSIHSLIAVGNTIYFVANDGSSGVELWKSQGTEESTVQVKDIYAGSASGNPEQLTNVNGVLFFTAVTNAAGKELWKSDGTAGGTVLVKDVFPKKGSSNPSYITNVNGTVYFSANDGVNGYELWKTDGTTVNTILVKDIMTGTKVSSAPEQLASLGNEVLFTANSPATGRELWKSDGTAEGTVLVKDIRIGTNTSAIKHMTSIGSLVMFTATDGVFGQELWKSDGTEAGTALVKDMTPGAPGSNGEQPFSDMMGNFTNINGTLFYTAYAGEEYLIWKSDGTEAGTIPLQWCSGPGIGKAKTVFTVMNGYIYYINEKLDAWEDNLHLWRMNMDGTNPVQIKDFYQNDFYDPYYPLLCAAGSYIYFTGRSNGEGHALFVSNGEPGNASRVIDAVESTLSSDLRNPFEVNNKVVFTTTIVDEEYNSIETIWSTDGTEAGTIPLLEDYYIEGSVKGDGVVYVSTGDGVWKTDGTLEGTVHVKTNPSGYNARDLRFIDGILYFTNYAGELWRSNGTSKGTYRVTDLNWINDMNGHLPGRLIFRHRTREGDDELWRSNGTAAGTYKLKTLNVGPVTRSSFYPTATIGTTHYFIANDGVYGNELWKTGGTASSTMIVTDLNPNDNNYVYGSVERDITALGVFRDTLYISAVDASGEWSLFKSTGTAAKTKKLIQMPPVMKMIPSGDKMFMFVYSSADMTTIDLWVTDGTVAGTQMIQDLNAGNYVSDMLHNDELYFSFYGSQDIWKSDGTACGTFTLDISPAKNPFNLTLFQNSIFFSGYTADIGNEPYKYDLSSAPESPCGTPVFATASLETTIEESRLSSYPNPFTNDFALRIKGEYNEKVNVQVSTLTGHPVEQFESLSSEEDHLLGQNWAPGIYIVKVIQGDMTESKIVVKK